jgi:hypothetical protein
MLTTSVSAFGQEEQTRVEVTELPRITPTFSLAVHKQMAPMTDHAWHERRYVMSRKGGLKWGQCYTGKALPVACRMKAMSIRHVRDERLRASITWRALLGRGSGGGRVQALSLRVQSSHERLERLPRWGQAANLTFRLRKSLTGINKEVSGDGRNRQAL